MYGWVQRASHSGQSLAAVDSLLSLQQQQEEGSDRVTGFGLRTSTRSVDSMLRPVSSMISTRTALPKAARDFLIKEHDGKGFLLLPHLWECRQDEMKTAMSL